MNLIWDLSPIYESIDSEGFKNDKKTYIKKINELNKWTEENFSSPENPKEKIEKYITKKNELTKFSKLSLYLNLLSSTNTSDEKTLKEIDQLEEIELNITPHEVNFIHFLKKTSNIDEIIKSSKILTDYEFYIKELKNYSQHILSRSEENINA